MNFWWLSHVWELVEGSRTFGSWDEGLRLQLGTTFWGLRFIQREKWVKQKKNGLQSDLEAVLWQRMPVSWASAGTTTPRWLSSVMPSEKWEKWGKWLNIGKQESRVNGKKCRREYGYFCPDSSIRVWSSRLQNRPAQREIRNMVSAMMQLGA